MAKIPSYDPLTTEAQSPLIAGITEGLNKLSGLLNLKTGNLTDVELIEVYIDDEHRYKLYQAPLGQKLWLTNPAPVIKKNGAVISANTANFTINHVGGSITFGSGSELTADDSVTVTATYIIEDSETLNAINEAIATLNTAVEKYKGYYATIEALEDAMPTANSGDFAIIGGDTNSVFIWNVTSSAWTNTYKETDLTNYYNKPDINNLLNQKENTVQAHGAEVESDNYYYGGRKTWQKLDTKVLNTLLTGLSITSGGEITSADTILSALGKLQNQVGGYIHPIRANGNPTTATVGILGQEYINTSNGDSFRCIEVSGNTYTWIANMAYKVDGTNIIDESIPSKALEASSVTTDKLVDANVTTDKLADKAVSRAKLADDAAYSPIVDVAESRDITPADFGKTLKVTTAGVVLTVPDELVASTAYGNWEVAVLKWPSAGSITIAQPENTEKYFVKEGYGSKSGRKVVMDENGAMCAIKKITNLTFLITGSGEVEEV